jgi:hypothetical protein
LPAESGCKPLQRSSPEFGGIKGNQEDEDNYEGGYYPFVIALFK